MKVPHDFKYPHKKCNSLYIYTKLCDIPLNGEQMQPQRIVHVESHKEGTSHLVQQESLLLQQTSKGKIPMTSAFEGNLGMKEEEMVEWKEWNQESYTHIDPLVSQYFKYVSPRSLL